jgi:hypothetical protein
LRNAHAAAGLFLLQTEFTRDEVDFDHQAGLDLEFFGIWQTQVGKDVAGARFDLDSFNKALCHLISPSRSLRLPSAERE